MPDPAERDAQWEREHLYVVFFDNTQGLGLCGCNRPADAYNLIRDLLNLLPWYESWPQTDQLIGTDGAVHIVQCQLGRIDLVEHGGTIGGAWATDKGRYVRWLMGRHEYDDLDEVGLPHDGKPCTPECWKPPAGLDLSDPEPGEPQQSPVDSLRDLAAAQEAAMTPGQRRVSDALTDLMLYGSVPLDQDGQFAPRTGTVGGVDHERALREVARIGLGRPSPVGDFPEFEVQRQRILDTFGIPARTRAEWAQLDRESIRRFLPQRSECRRYDSGTWVHAAVHSCPKAARG